MSLCGVVDRLVRLFGCMFCESVVDDGSCSLVSVQFSRFFFSRFFFGSGSPKLPRLTRSRPK